MHSLSICLLLAVLLDYCLGEPQRFHPLVGFGRLAAWIDRAFRPTSLTMSGWPMKVRGLLAVMCLIAPFTALAYGASRLPYLGALSKVVLLYLAIGATSLQQHADAVRKALLDKDLNLARRRVGMIVSRDVTRLEEVDVARATVESVLENGSDAIFAALFWFMVLGTPGAVLYRLSNTLDAMWGYKTERYRHFGWAAARLDDVLNYLPARLTALTYILLGNTRDGWRCWRRQAATWYSPNAGPVMSAGAGALGLILGGPAPYHGKMKSRPVLGMGRNPTAHDIWRATQLVRSGVWLWLLLALTGGWFLA